MSAKILRPTFPDRGPTPTLADRLAKLPRELQLCSEYFTAKTTIGPQLQREIERIRLELESCPCGNCGLKRPFSHWSDYGLPRYKVAVYETCRCGVTTQRPVLT